MLSVWGLLKSMTAYRLVKVTALFKSPEGIDIDNSLLYN